MSGESAQDIEVSITAPNRSFHATVIASDVSWADRSSDPQPQLPPRRPIWSSAFGDSIDTVESESLDPMINSGTSLSQDSYDGFAVEFISSNTDYMNGGVSTGFTGGASDGATATRAPDAAAAAFTAPARASDAVSTSVEMRPTGFAETDRGSISCEMITSKPVLVGNGSVPFGETTVTSSASSTTVTTGDGTTVTSSHQSTTTVTSSSSSDFTVTSGAVTSSAADSTGTTVTASGDGSGTTVTGGHTTMTTNVPMAPGSTFQMELVESQEEHAEAPERPRDRAMSLHERSLLAHDLHALSSTMDTIRDEDEEVHVGNSNTEDKQPDEPYATNRRQSLTGVPVCANTFIAHTQPTIFEAAENGEAAHEQNGAPAADATPAAPTAAETATSTSFSSQYSSTMTSSSAVTSSSGGTEAASTTTTAAPVSDDVSPYLKRLLEAQEQTRQLMALLGESTQMLGALPTSKPEDKEHKDEDKPGTADAAAAVAKALAAASEIASSVSFASSQSSSSMTSSSATTGAAAPVADAVPASPSAVPASPGAVPQSPAGNVPPSPALEISSRPIDITIDDAPAVQTPTVPATPSTLSAPSGAVPEEASSTSTSSGTSSSPEGTQNATICSALENIASHMTTVTTTNAESSSSSTVTTTAPLSLSAPVLQLEEATSPTTSLAEEPGKAPSTPTPDTASLLHESTVFGLSVGLPTPRPTPEPDQERFVTNNEQSEATISKSSFTLEASTTSSSTETGTVDRKTSTTDFVPTTTIVLTPDEPATPAPMPAAEKEPTLTPAAVDVPVEIVRRLDDAASWSSVPAPESDSGAKEVPISVVPAGPPPLARDPPPLETEAIPPPPPLAKEPEEHHEFSRSVMVERRVLSPDSAKHAEQTSSGTTSTFSSSSTTTSSQVTTSSSMAASDLTTDSAISSEKKSDQEVPVPVTQEAPKEQETASTEIPVTVWKQEDSSSVSAAPVEPKKQDQASTEATTEIPVTVWKQEPVLACELQQRPTEDAVSTTTESQQKAEDTAASTEIPVTVWKQEEPSTPAAPAAADEPPLQVTLQPAQSQTDAAKDEAPTQIPVTVVAQPSDATVTQPQTETKQEGAVDIPVTVSGQTTGAEATVEKQGTTPSVDSTAASVDKPSTENQTSSDSHAAPQEIPASTENTVSTDKRALIDSTSSSHEVPVANAAQQEKENGVKPAGDEPVGDAVEGSMISPTTSHAPVSLESTFQISPTEHEEVAHPPDQLRDRAMSIHEKSLLAHDSSGFAPALEPVPESDEVHVANAGMLEASRRRASVAPGVDGVPTSAFQLPSTSCLFAIDEASGADAPDSETTAPAPSTPSNEESGTTTMASSTGTDVIDVTASEAAPEAQLQQQSGGVKWLTESEAGAPPAHEHSRTPDSPQVTVVAAAPQQETHAAAEAPPQTPKSPAAPVATWVTEPAAPTADATPATPTQDQQPPPTPGTPGTPVASWVTVPAAITTSDAPQTPTTPAATPVVSEPAQEAQPSQENQAPPQTPKTPTGVSWVTEPAATTTAESSQPAQAAQDAQVPPQTPKTPTGVTWISEQATTEPAQATTVPAESQVPPPQTPKTPTGVSWITEPSSTTAEQPAQTEQQNQIPPQTPKTPTGVSWITEPASAPATETPSTQSEAPPQTPKTPSGVSWITEAPSGVPDVAGSATSATTKPPSVINITAPPDGSVEKGGGAASPHTPTSPGIRWASDTTRTGGNVADAGAAPPPSESTFVVNAPWEGKDAPASAPDADGVTWITETPKEAAEAEQKPRPPLTRSESTRSEREASSATDVTVRAASPPKKTLAPSISGEEDSLKLTNGVTQESMGTKVRKLSWADQQPSQAEDSFSAAIDDYEKKLNETTEQTKQLVDLLCQTGNQITENSMKMSDIFSDANEARVRSMLDQERRDRAAAALSPIAENGESSFTREPPPQLIAGALPPNVESVIVSCEELKYVTGCLVLENAHILVTDEESGLFLFTLDSKVVRHITNPAWKRAASPVIFKDRLKSYILVLMDCKDEEDGSWVRHIVKFSENLDYIEKVECPKWIRERTILSDRLAVNRYENIYYCANGEIFSGLYELAPTGKWTELLYRQSESFVDMLAFAIIGPIQQILIVEGRRDHVLLCSIRESVCVEARRMAICERPGALARDESGRLFVMNRAQAAVQIVDTRVWAACRNMALVDKFVPHFSASFGMLVIPQKRAVKVHKYSFEWDDMPM